MAAGKGQKTTEFGFRVDFSSADTTSGVDSSLAEDFSAGEDVSLFWAPRKKK
jgi:hypothetical protein